MKIKMDSTKLVNGRYKISWGLIALMMCSFSAQGQGRNHDRYMGAEATYGIRFLSISSTISEIDEQEVVEEGGSVGAVFGDEFVRARLRVASADYTSGSYTNNLKLFRLEGQINFYPLQFIRTHRQLMDVFLLGGISWDGVSFYGHRLMPDRDLVPSSLQDRYLGKVTQWSGMLGLGAEYQVPYVASFLHLFAEVKLAFPLLVSTNRELLSGTTLGNFTALTFGVSFGFQHERTKDGLKKNW